MFDHLKHTIQADLHAIADKAESAAHAAMQAWEHSTMCHVIGQIWVQAGTLEQKLLNVFRAGYHQAQLDAQHNPVDATKPEPVASETPTPAEPVNVG